MATTTPSVIRSALETTIAAITPHTSSYGSATYSVAAGLWDWTSGKRPSADIDREFTIGDIPPGKAPWFGGVSECIVETALEIIIGHKMTKDVSAGEARRERDLEQLARKIEYPGNYPTSVCVIHFEGASYQQVPASPDGAWISRLRFAMQYLADPDGE